MGDDGFVTWTANNRVAVVTIDRPPVNALSAAAFADLGRVADQISRDESINVAIVTATGRTFCAGADVKELAEQGPAERVAFFELTRETRRKVIGIPVPVIAAINGPAAGAGVSYACYCDYRVASDAAFLTMPEINLGSVAAGGMPLMGIGVPAGALRYLLYSGRRVSAQDALRVHLVDEVVPSADLMVVAHERAAVIAEKDRPTLVAMKRAIREASSNPRADEAAYDRTQRMTIDLLRHTTEESEYLR